MTRSVLAAALVVSLACVPALVHAAAPERYHAHGFYAFIPMMLSVDGSDIVIRYCHDVVADPPSGTYRIPYDTLRVVGEPTGYRVEVEGDGWRFWTAHHAHDGRILVGYGSDWGIPMAAPAGAPALCAS